MLHRTDNRPIPLEVQALYSIAALARAAHVHKRTLQRVLKANHVELLHAGRALFVPLSEIQRKIPALFASLQAAETIRQAARRGGAR
jgi:hypothetical protein